MRGSEVAETATLKPVNGVLRGDECGRYPASDHWRPTLDEAKVSLATVKDGDPCPLCAYISERKRMGLGSQWARGYTGCKLVVMKRTILGPIHEVRSTGNPLIDAASILQADGWVRGSYVCEEGKKCLAGAVRAACGILPSPETETSEFVEKYTTRKWYQDGVRRSARALVTLAVAIHERKKPVKKTYGSALTLYSADLHDWEHTLASISTNPSTALEVVTTFNDEVLTREGDREEAIKLLKKAGRSFNPRLKLRQYTYYG
jgi:hypothetical protein